MQPFEGNTANDVWLKAAAKLKSSEVVRQQSSRAGDTRELLGALFVIQNPRQRWIFSREPAFNPAFALAEVVWIMSGRNDSAFLNHWNPKLPQFAGNGTKYHGAYGYRLRKQFGLDQLERAYLALRNNPESRQVVLQIWDCRTDMPQLDGRPADRDIPCNICSFAKIRDGKLEWTQILRSNDLILGVPHNFVQFTSMQEILAAWLNVEVGSYKHFSDSLHIYGSQLEYIDDSVPIEAEENDDILRFSKEESDTYFAEMSARMNKMMVAGLNERKLRHLARAKHFPKAMENWLLVIAADCARRRGWIALAHELMTECSNPGLRQMWQRWLARWKNIQREEKISENVWIYQTCFDFLNTRFSH